MSPEEWPASGVRFHRPIFESRERDTRGRVKKIEYLRWIRETADSHWKAVRPESAANLSWVAVQHEIHILDDVFPMMIAATWVGAVTEETIERFCEIAASPHGSLLARSRTIYSAVDVTTGQPIRIDPAIKAALFRRLRPKA